MTKKDFSGVSDNALAFLSDETIEEAEKGRKPARKPKRTYRQEKEAKTRRVQLLIQPSIYEAIQRKADKEDLSVNEAIIQAIIKYTNR